MNKRMLMFVIAVLVTMVSLSTTGCEPFRKKFTREKRKDRASAFVPVLDPIDYPPEHVSSKDKYDYYYSLWAVWERDLLKAIDDRAFDKKLQYNLSQEIVQLEEMKKWVTDDKAQGLNPSLERLYKIQKQIINTPAQMRNMYSIRRDLEIIASDVRHNFKPEENFPYKE